MAPPPPGTYAPRKRAFADGLEPYAGGDDLQRTYRREINKQAWGRTTCWNEKQERQPSAARIAKPNGFTVPETGKQVHRGKPAPRLWRLNGLDPAKA